MHKAYKTRELTLEIGVENKFSNSAAKYIGQSLSEFKELEFFKLIIRANNEISEQGIDYLTKSISTYDKLRSFYFVMEYLKILDFQI